MKKVQENNSLMNGFEELDDDMLDGVAGGLVQLVNPSSSRLGGNKGDKTYFYDGRTCPLCGSKDMVITGVYHEWVDGVYDHYYVSCDACGNRMGTFSSVDIYTK